MSPEFIAALLSGRRAEAEAIAGLALPANWPGDDERFLRLRLPQLRADPSIQPWLMRARQIGEQMDEEDGLELVQELVLE